MHMADALISPLVGGGMWAAAIGTAGYSIKKIQRDMNEKIIPLMGVMGAFIFTAQMINFSIPGTGSSGHLGGGILLAILLGPYAGFLTMMSILTIQALFFADGGLLALGCNIINLGFYTCFIAYPFIYKQIIRKKCSRNRIIIGSILSAIVGLQMGAFSVVMETMLSGKTELPFTTFLLLMQPIHLAIGVIEGLVTASIVIFVWNVHPEIIENSLTNKIFDAIPVKKFIISFAAAALILGTVLSWYASTNPDGLEWSIQKIYGKESLESSDSIHRSLAQVQKTTAFFPDYGWREKEKANKNSSTRDETRTNVNTETSVSGVVGGIMTLILAISTGFIIHFIKRKKRRLNFQD